MPFSATLQLQAFAEGKCAPVSIHAPACGGRHRLDRDEQRLKLVSIHARVWRATQQSNELINYMSFNPRPRVAGDVEDHHRLVWFRMFQSTPACGGRRYGRTSPACCPRFNPRPRVAGDLVCGLCAIDMFVSIHARVWRATPGNLWTPSAQTSFQSTPACGGRPDGLKDCTMYVSEFQSTPACGGRL